MVEGTPGVEAKASAPDEAVHRLEERAGEIRENLGELVDELDHRRQRWTKPLVVGAVALVALSLGGVILWRMTRRRPSRMEELARALRRIGKHSEDVAQEPSVGKKIAASAGAALAAIVVRRLAQEALAVGAGVGGGVVAASRVGARIASQAP
jgi:hypothetical protein